MELFHQRGLFFTDIRVDTIATHAESPVVSGRIDLIT